MMNKFFRPGGPGGPRPSFVGGPSAGHRYDIDDVDRGDGGAGCVEVLHYTGESTCDHTPCAMSGAEG